MKAKKVFTNVRVIILIVCIILSIAAIKPNPWKEGAAIRNLDFNSTASNAGITRPTPELRPMSREVITSINNIPITNAQDFYEYQKELSPNVSIQIKTLSHFNEQGEMSLFGSPRFYNLITPAIQNGSEYVNLGIEVYDAPKTNIKKGIDLDGGMYILLKPEEKLSPDQMSSVIENMKKRLNVYGLSDIIVRQVNDLTTQYIRVEIAGATREQIKKLVESQGKFEAKIANQTVFIGGEDIPHVYRTATQSGLDPTRSCGQQQDGTWSCTFYFTIALTPEAGKKFAEATEPLEVISENGQDYLSQDIEFWVDDEFVSSLKIGSDLKGNPTTTVRITGPGQGRTQIEAKNDAYAEMKELQTILETGSLPVKLISEDVRVFPPTLGKKSIKVVLLIGLAAILAVAIVIFIRYRKLAISIPLSLTSIAEVVLLMGFAAMVGWNLDIAAITGIIIAVGTGVDHLIVITDEIMKGEHQKLYSWKENIKRAFFIIMAAYFTTVVALIPLGIIGAGALRGFAVTTIAGITFGVLLTRPAYAAIVEILLKK